MSEQDSLDSALEVISTHLSSVVEELLEEDTPESRESATELKLAYNLVADYAYTARETATVLGIFKELLERV